MNENTQDRIKVKDVNGVEHDLILERDPLMACVVCGNSLYKKYTAICSDCGANFCQTCVEDGTFASHNCEELEDEYDEDE